MAKKNSYSAIALLPRPLSKSEMEAQRPHFKDMSRVELEDLLIRAAFKLEGLAAGYIGACKKLREQQTNMARGPAARLAKDEKQEIKRACEEQFLDRLAKRALKRGDRAQFIRDMACKYEKIEDPRTFGEWWDEWLQEVRTGGSNLAIPTTETIAYWEEWRRKYEALPKILQTLGCEPKELPPWPEDTNLRSTS